MGTVYNPSIVTDGLVLCLDAANRKSYPGSGNNWNTVTATGLTAVKYGSQSPTYPQWNSSGYFTFTGGVTADNYSRFQVANIPSFSAFSVFAWVRSTTYDYRSILRMQNSDFELTFSSSTVFAMAAGTNYDDIGASFTDATISDGRWHQYGLTFDGQNLLGYYDGVKKVTQTRGTPTTTAAGILMIGTRNDAYAAHYTGDISVITINSRVLTDNEIVQNYNALRGRHGR